MSKVTTAKSSAAATIPTRRNFPPDGHPRLHGIFRGPKPPSRLEARFELLWRAQRGPDLEKEFRFLPPQPRGGIRRRPGKIPGSHLGRMARGPKRAKKAARFTPNFTPGRRPEKPDRYAGIPYSTVVPAASRAGF